MTSRSARILRSRFVRFLLLAALPAGLGSCGGGAGPAWSPAPPVAEGPPFVELARLDGPAPLAGDRVTGGPGDWLLRNERLAVVVSTAADTLRPAGSIIDAAPAGGRDLLDVLDPVGILGPPERPVMREVFAESAADSAVRTLVARGRAGENGALSVENRISLRAGSNAVRLVTRVVNLGDRPVLIPGFGDFVGWAGADMFVPGWDDRPSDIREPAPFLLAAGRGAAYAWVAPDTAVMYGAGTFPRFLRGLRSMRAKTLLPPDSSAVFERSLLVTRGSWAEAAEPAWSALGETPAHVLVTMVDPHGAPVGGAVVEARDAVGRIWMRGITDDRGGLALPVPAGRYELRANHPERRADEAKMVAVDGGGVARAAMKASEPGRLRLSAFDGAGRALASRWVLTGREADGSDRRSFLVARGGEEVLLPPGDYDAVASHGPAYQEWSGEVRARADSARPARAVLEALVPDTEWIAADLDPGDAEGTPAGERLKGLEADGVRVAVAESPAAPNGPSGGGVELVTPERLAALDIVRIPLGGDPHSLRLAWSDWLGRLAAGEQVVAVAASKHLGTAGPPVPPPVNRFAPAPEPVPYLAERNLVDVGDDGPGGPAGFMAAVAAGRVQGTMGPLVEFDLNGERLGSIVDVEPGPVRGHVRVVAPPSMDVREVLIYVNDRVQDVYRVRGNDPVRFDEDIELHMSEPGFVLVRVDGFPGPRTVPAGPGNALPDRKNESPSQTLQPLAFTNPIRVAISGERR